eukprot:PhF_6_TR30397/c0_g1_i2/m.44565
MMLSLKSFRHTLHNVADVVLTIAEFCDEHSILSWRTTTRIYHRILTSHEVWSWAALRDFNIIANPSIKDTKKKSDKKTSHKSVKPKDNKTAIDVDYPLMKTGKKAPKKKAAAEMNLPPPCDVPEVFNQYKKKWFDIHCALLSALTKLRQCNSLREAHTYDSKNLSNAVWASKVLHSVRVRICATRTTVFTTLALERSWKEFIPAAVLGGLMSFASVLTSTYLHDTWHLGGYLHLMILATCINFDQGGLINVFNKVPYSYVTKRMDKSMKARIALVTYLSATANSSYQVYLVPPVLTAMVSLGHNMVFSSREMYFLAYLVAVMVSAVAYDECFGHKNVLGGYKYSRVQTQRRHKNVSIFYAVVTIGTTCVLSHFLPEHVTFYGRVFCRVWIIWYWMCTLLTNNYTRALASTVITYIGLSGVEYFLPGWLNTKGVTLGALTIYAGLEWVRRAHRVAAPKKSSDQPWAMPACVCSILVLGINMVGESLFSGGGGANILMENVVMPVVSVFIGAAVCATAVMLF